MDSANATIRLAPGLYEELIDELVQKGIEDAERGNLRAQIRDLDPGDSHEYFARHLASHIRTAFASIPEVERVSRQIELANRIIRVLADSSPDDVDPKRARVLRAELLLSLLHAPVELPDTPLSASCLMTGTRQDPSLVSQLRKEIASADSVDILCSFIKWGGIRILGETLCQFTAAARPLRVITTSYLGATDIKAVDFLRALPQTDIRITYDTRRTRLHAKAYIIHRKTGYGVAYIGSSNLSQAALTDGLEWNVKISQKETPHIWAKVCATFDTYWNDAEFTPYRAEDREQLKLALQRERGGTERGGLLTLFDIKPYPYQQEILDKLSAERVIHGRCRNLVIAATGTGKTLVAAFDYARFKRRAEAAYPSPGPTRLLYVAHREEILKHSLGRFRAVLRDQNFGDLLVGAFEPDHLDHLFISIQSFNSREFWNRVPRDFYDFVVVDEFHHAAAPSYRRLIDFVQPQVLLGLTATPERMDGFDILGYFGGHAAAEIRLPDAINRKLLCPFQYFGISDTVDYRDLRWQRGGYVIEDLDRILTGNDIRVQLVLDKVSALLLDVHRARGLGFCVSIKHAEYMAAAFNRAGIPAEALSANSTDEIRQTVQDRLVSRKINFIFVVDLYNEGVDIPDVDSILLLRPTESLTVFLQQLGRGLRLTEDKECLTVLDFIGQAHHNFSFEARFRALVGQTPRHIDKEIEQGFPHLPAGCVINLERIAAHNVLQNIHQAVSQSRARLLRRIATYETETGRAVTLRDFLEYHHLGLDDVYLRGTWSRLLVDSGLRPDLQDTDEVRLSKGLRRMTHINGVRQLRTLLSVLPRDPDAAFVEPQDEIVQRFFLMLHFTIWGREWCPSAISESVARLRNNPTLYCEILEVLALKLELAEEMPPSLEIPFTCPLDLHADYTRDEVLAALGVWTLSGQRDMREGVVYVPSLPADVLFITLNKTEAEYSPSTMYEDYAISDELFHWQSQSTTSAASPTGQRYIHHCERGSEILLCVREDKRRNGMANPFVFLGPADYLSSEGGRPMSIVWRLRNKLPPRLLRNIQRLAAG